MAAEPIPTTREGAIMSAIAEAQADENHELVLALLAELRAGKPGALTTEFLVALLLGVAGVYLAGHDRLELAALVWSLAGGAYTAARALAKASAPKPVAPPAPAIVSDPRQDGPPIPSPKLAGAVLLAVGLALLSGCYTLSSSAAHQIAVDAAATQGTLRDWDKMTPAQQRKAIEADARDFAALDAEVNGTPIPEGLK